MATSQNKLSTELSPEERKELLAHVKQRVKKVFSEEMENIKRIDDVILQVRSLPKPFPMKLPDLTPEQIEADNRAWEEKKANQREEARLMKVKEEEKKKDIEIQTLRKLIDKYPEIAADCIAPRTVVK